MHRSCIRILAVTTAIFGATAASGQDFTGFVGIDLGPDLQHARDDLGYEESGPGGWAAVYGRLGVDLADEATMQFDAWLRRGEGEIERPTDSYAWEQLQAGAAAHLTYRSGNFLAGAAGSVGAFNGNNGWKSTLGTVAVEGGFEAEEFSLVGQLGYTGALSGQAKDIGEEIVFVALDATYYLTPDLSVSAQLSWSRYTDEPDTVDEKDVTTLVAGVEYKLPDSPVILTASYMAEHYDYVNDAADFYAVNQRVTVGARLPFGAGADTLRDLDWATGLEHPAGYYNR